MEHGEVTWGQLLEGLIRKRIMSQASLSKYKRSLEKRGWIKAKLDDEGKKVYVISENKIDDIKKWLNALTSSEQIKMYKSWWIRTLEVIAKAPDIETLKKKQKAAKELLKHFKK